MASDEHGEIDRKIRHLHGIATTFPRGSPEWAATLAQLGEAWNARDDGDPIENADKAIRSFRMALPVFTREAYPIEWARTHAGMAIALKNRALAIPSLAVALKGSVDDRRERDVRRAAASLKKARSVFSRESFPDLWAILTTELGTLYWKHQRHRTPADLNVAVTNYRQALAVLESGSREWALVAVNLAGAMYEKHNGPTTIPTPDEVEAVEALYVRARAVFREEGPRLEYARATANLARIYRGTGRPADRDRALQLLREAAESQEREEGGLRDAIRSLATAADMLLEDGAFDEAADLYVREVLHVEALCRAADRPARRVEIIREYSRDFDCAIRCLVRAGRAGEAMEITERIRAATLLELAAEGQQPPISADEIRMLAATSGSTFVVFRVTTEGTVALLAFPTGEIDAVEIAGFTEDVLSELALGMDESDPRGFILGYFSGHDTLELTRDDAHSRWSANAAKILATLYERLVSRVHERLKGRGRHIVIVPGRALSILPLHACNWQTGGITRYLIDEFVISYAPSLTILRHCIARESRRAPWSFLALCDPETGQRHLPFAAWEGAELRELMDGNETVVLISSEATKGRFIAEARGRTVLHLSCHAGYFLDAPLDSAFYLARGETITLRELIAHRVFQGCRLVVASGCETAFSEPSDPSEERLGLAPVILASGAGVVWGSLWSVRDDCAALMAIKAYQTLLGGAASEAEALRSAQCWLRDATGDELLAFVASCRTPAPPELAASLGAYRSERPYAHVDCWAPLVCLGPAR